MAAKGCACWQPLRPDVLLLDIAMPGDRRHGGRACRRCIREGRRRSSFVTAHDHFAVQAFDLAVADYLLKPVTQERLDRALQRIRPLPSASPASAPASGPGQDLWVPSGGQLCRVPVTTIDLVEAERDYVRLHVGTRSFLMSGTLTSIESRLNPDQFVRAPPVLDNPPLAGVSDEAGAPLAGGSRFSRMGGKFQSDGNSSPGFVDAGLSKRTRLLPWPASQGNLDDGQQRGARCPIACQCRHSLRRFY